MIEQYDIYTLTMKETCIYMLIGFGISSLTAVLFYNSFFAVILLCPYSYFYMTKKKVELAKKRKWEMNLQFKDCMLSIMAALNAGYSIENSFNESLKEMRQLHTEHSYIVPELEYIVRQLGLNRSIEDLLLDFGNRTGIEDIMNFAEVFSVTKRTGGDLIKIIRLCCSHIGGKIEVKRDIVTMIAAKRFEAKIMNGVLYAIIIYLLLFSPGFLSPVYHNIAGILFMTVVIGVYLGALKLSEQIMEFEV